MLTLVDSEWWQCGEDFFFFTFCVISLLFMYLSMLLVYVF